MRRIKTAGRTTHHRIGGRREFIIVGVDSNTRRESFIAYNGFALVPEFDRRQFLRWSERADAARVVAHLVEIQKYYSVWLAHRLQVSELGQSPEGKPLALDLPSSQGVKP